MMKKVTIILLILGSSMSLSTSALATTETIQNLAEFNFDNGANPFSGLTLDPSGLFYGTTEWGYSGAQPSGTLPTGTVYSFNPVTDTINTLAAFPNTNVGGGDFNIVWADSDLVAGPNQTYYTITRHGGPTNDGSIYAFNPKTNSLTDLADFNGTNGSNGVGNLTWENGLFYGTTTEGGANNGGTIFSFDPNTDHLTKLADLNSINADSSEATLTFDNGIFYGVTSGGGSTYQGTIFSFDPSNPSNIKLTKLADFNGTNGSGPSSGLTLSPQGILYGTTYSGGANGDGTIYSFDPSKNNQLTKLADFSSSTGIQPLGHGQLKLGTNGLLYGTAAIGGANGDGTLYSFNPNGNVLTKLDDFNSTSNGNWPSSGVTIGSDGKLYGTAVGGGSATQGTIFSFDPVLPIGVPEPLTILGNLSALGLCASLKRRLKKTNR